MPNWKKVITSGSDAHLNDITASGNISASGTGSFDYINVTNDINLGGTDHIRFASDQGFSLASNSSETFQISAGDDDDDIYLAFDGNGTDRVTTPKVLELTGTTDATDATGDTGILRVEGGASIAKKVFIGTDLDVDGTTNLDAVNISATTQIDADVTLTADGVGADFKVFGNESGKFLFWENNADRLIIKGNFEIDGQISGSQDLRLGYKPDAGSFISASSDGTIEISGSGESATLNVEGSITASNDISASGNLISNVLNIDDKIVHTGDDDTKITFATDSLRVTAGNVVNTTFNSYGTELQQPITASNDISCSGDYIGNRRFDKTGNTAIEHSGDIVYLGGTTSMDAGKIYHYKSDGTWEIADADAAVSCDGLLAVALGTASDTNGMLLRGTVTLDHDPGAVGDVLFLDRSSNAGQATAVAPSGNTDIVRVVGYCLDASNGQIWFNPDNTFVEVSA